MNGENDKLNTLGTLSMGEIAIISIKLSIAGIA